MKKILALILALTLVFSLVSCNKGDGAQSDEVPDKSGDIDDYGGEPVSAFSGIIIEVRDNSILVEPDAESNEAKSSDRISVSLNDIVFNAKIGDRVAIMYKGSIAESDPAQITGTVSIDVVYDWGITLSVKNITPTGLTLVCTQNGGEVTGEINTGEDYFLEVMTDNGWERVTTVIEEYAWNSIAYMVTLDGITVWDVDWNWLYGELEKGTYRLGKSFMDFRGTGDYDNAVFYAEFEICDEEFQTSSNIYFDAEALGDILNEHKIDPTVVTGGYKLYSLKSNNGFGFLIGARPADFITNEYDWVIPRNDNDTAYWIHEENGEWKTSMLTSPKIVDLEKVDNAMGELQDEGKQIDEITIFEDTGFYTVFVYIKTDNGEYLMQFAERPDFTGLENGVLYTWDEVETAIYEGFALEQFIDPNEDLSKSGGVPKILITK